MSHCQSHGSFPFHALVFLCLYLCQYFDTFFPCLGRFYFTSIFIPRSPPCSVMAVCALGHVAPLKECWASGLQLDDELSGFASPVSSIWLPVCRSLLGNTPLGVLPQSATTVSLLPRHVAKPWLIFHQIVRHLRMQTWQQPFQGLAFQ